MKEMLTVPFDVETIISHYQDAFSFEAGIARLQGILESTILKK